MPTNIDDWIIVPQDGMVLIGRETIEDVVVLLPVYELKTVSSLLPDGRGGVALVNMRAVQAPLGFNSIKSWAFRGGPFVQVRDLAQAERNELAKLIDQHEANLTAQRSNLVIAPAGAVR